MRHVLEEARISCAADPRALWPVVADTERLNRAVGLGPITISALETQGAARYLVRTELAGGTVEYEEQPFEWRYPERFRVVRKMRSGPLTELEVGIRFAPRPRGGSLVDVSLRVAPRSPELAPALAGAAAAMVAKMVREVRRVDRALRAGGPLPRVGRARTRERALSRALAELTTNADAPLHGRLERLLRKGSDVDVTRIRPFELADEWGEERAAVLATCLCAVRSGLLELRWEIVCPSCRTGTEVVSALDALESHARCQLCDVDFDVSLDACVEATFAPAAAVREVDASLYCLGGPARMPHVLVQAILPAKERVRLAAPQEVGAYQLFVRGGRVTRIVVADDGAPRVSLDDSLTATEPRVRPGGEIEVESTVDQDRHVKLERSQFRDQSATAQFVLGLPAFRRDFSTEVLRSGMALRVAKVGLFFSDLTGSTELYARVGDAAAFRVVQDHFDVLFECVERHGGVVVKTIGDAVMASFNDDLRGVAAAVDGLRRFALLQEDDPRFATIGIKLGYFAGTCYAVTANGRLDYFGQSVNIAARLQGQAESGELVIPLALAEQAVREGVLGASQIASSYDASLRGVSGSVVAARIRL